MRQQTWFATTVCTIAVLALLLCSDRSFAFLDSGNDIYKACLSDLDFLKGACVGTASGLYDMMQSQYRCGRESNLNRRQVADVLMKFLRDHPETRNDPAYHLAVTAYSAAFDCSLK